MCSQTKDSYQLVWTNLLDMFICRGYDIDHLDQSINIKHIETLKTINLLCLNMKNDFYKHFVSMSCLNIIDALKNRFFMVEEKIKDQIKVDDLNSFMKNELMARMTSDMEIKTMYYFLKCFLNQELIDEIIKHNEPKDMIDLCLDCIDYSRDKMTKTLEKTNFWHFLTPLCKVNDYKGQPIFVFLETCDGKPKKEYVSMCTEYSKEYGSKHFIIIYYCDLVNAINQEKDLQMRQNPGMQIEIFESSFFYCNVARHYMQSSQRILRGNDKKQYLAHFKENEIMTKMAKQSDIICKYYNARPGDIIVYYDVDYKKPISIRQCCSG